jgi:hypothetical protein
MVLAFAKAMGEFGATITFVSNIPGRTQTIPSAIYAFLQVPGGEASAFRLILVSIAVSIGAVLVAELLARRATRRGWIGHDAAVSPSKNSWAIFRSILHITAGDGVTALFGRSGAGKSTVIKAVAGLVTPDSGHIQLGDQVLLTRPAIDSAGPQATHWACLPGCAALSASLVVEEPALRRALLRWLGEAQRCRGNG